MNSGQGVEGERGSLNAKLIGLLVATVLVLILVYNMTRSMAVGQLEGTATKSLKSLNKALAIYSSMWGGFPLSLSELAAGKTKIIGPEFAAGERGGYVFTYTPADPLQGSRIAAGYSIVARPEDSAIHARNFFTDQSGVIRHSPPGVQPDANSPPF